MSCRPLGHPQIKQYYSPRYRPSDNPKPTFFNKPSPNIDSYLCDSPTELSALMKSLVGQSRKRPNRTSFGLNSITGLAGIAPLFTSPASNILGAPKLSAGPTTPMAKLLYDIMMQLEDFELEAKLKVPVVDKKNRRKITTHTHVVLGEHGKLELARIEFDPHWGPMTIPHPITRVLGEIPIVGIFAYIRVLKVEMNPNTRKIQARVAYLGIPFNKDLQATLVEKGNLPSDLIKGHGYDLRRGLPKHSWKIAEIAEKLKEQGLLKLGRKTGVDNIIPLFEQGKVWLSGDFSNQDIRIGGVRLQFFPKQAGEKHRILIQGSLLKPVLKIQGLKSFELDHPKGKIHFENLDPKARELVIHLEVNKNDPKRSALRIPEFNNRGFRIHATTRGKDPQSLKLNLKKGLLVKGLWFRMEASGPHLHIDKVAGRQIDFTGLGVSFRTSPKDTTTLKNVHFSMRHGQPHFYSKINGQANGEISYLKGSEELAWMQFNRLKGNGSLELGVDSSKRSFFRLAGRLSTKVPKLRLLVRSEKLKAVVRTEIHDAQIVGKGSLTLWPRDLEALLIGWEKQNPFQVKGSRGNVWIQQDPSKVKAWPELKQKLGANLAKRVKTDLRIDLKEIAFEVGRMQLHRTLTIKGQQPALEILDAQMSGIRIEGDLYGKLFTRLPGGIHYPLHIPKTSKMKDAVIRIGGLKDKKNPQGRQVTFRKIFISGIESNTTLNPRDQKRCGFDRQQLHTELGLFQFNPDTKAIQMQQFGQDFKIYLKNPPFLGGCLKVD